MDVVSSESDLVATWQVPMSDKMHKIEFEHGTTTGKRILRVDGKEILRHEWMFKLVGREMFELNGVRCAVSAKETKANAKTNKEQISIDAVGIFAYEYSLTVGGKAFEKFREQQKKSLQVWHVRMGEREIRVCLGKGGGGETKPGTDTTPSTEKDTMDVWVNGSKVNTTGEFADEGTKTHLELATGSSAYILSESSGNRHIGMVHRLFVNDSLVKPSELADEGEENEKPK